MFSVLIRGLLIDNPVVRSGKAGDYTTAKIVTREGPERLYTSLIAFGTKGVHLARMTEGDHLSVIGDAKIREWTSSDGTARFGLSMTVDMVTHLGLSNKVDHVMALGQPKPVEGDETEVEDEEDLPF